MAPDRVNRLFLVIRLTWEHFYRLAEVMLRRFAAVSYSSMRCTHESCKSGLFIIFRLFLRFSIFRPSFSKGIPVKTFSGRPPSVEKSFFPIFLDSEFLESQSHSSALGPDAEIPSFLGFGERNGWCWNPRCPTKLNSSKHISFPQRIQPPHSHCSFL